MNVELKKVKYHEDMSDETSCFSAEVWVDGVRTATVENSGKGGGNDYLPVDMDRFKAFSEWCKAQPHEFDFEYEDQAIDRLLSEWEHQRWLKRVCRNKTVFRLKGDKPDTWRTVKHIYDAAVKAYMQQKYGDKIETIANEEVTA